MKGKDLRIHASASCKLMAGDNQLTEKQFEEMKSLESRQQLAIIGQAKPLTEKMADNLTDLQIRAAAPLELGKSAKTMVTDIWRFKEKGFRVQVFDDKLTKGTVTELDCIDLMDEVYPEDQIREKNTVRKTNDWLTGECDVELAKIKSKRIEDMKSTWSLPQFMDKDTPSEEYYSQGQSYMDLYGYDEFWLCYCLVNTPEFLIRRLQWKLFYQFRMNQLDKFDELLLKNTRFQEACEQIAKNHTYDHLEPAERIRIFKFERNDDYIKELHYRADWCKDYYDSISMTRPPSIVPPESFKRTYMYKQQ